MNISNSATSFFEWTSCAFVFLNCFFKSLTVYVHFHDLYTSRDRLNTFDTLSHCRCENGSMLFLIISIQYSYIFIFQLFSWIFSAALFFHTASCLEIVNTYYSYPCILKRLFSTHYYSCHALHTFHLLDVRVLHCKLQVALYLIHFICNVLIYALLLSAGF